jgi:predicted AAA+ superfamily ATPase
MENKYIKRFIDKYLIDWKKSAKHKPLLLRGARQVGKSSSVRHLGKKFDSFLEKTLHTTTISKFIRSMQ